MKRDFTALFCFVDDFIINFDKNSFTINNYKTKTGPQNYLSRSEVLTILIGFYQSSSDCFKNCYNHVILNVNYLIDKCTGISFVDSTSIAVCKNYRIYSHKVFDGLAKRGKTTKGWFYGLKLDSSNRPLSKLVI